MIQNKCFANYEEFHSHNTQREASSYYLLPHIIRDLIPSLEQNT